MHYIRVIQNQYDNQGEGGGKVSGVVPRHNTTQTRIEEYQTDLTFKTPSPVSILSLRFHLPP